MEDRNDILLSIKPFYAAKILSGEKTIELRKNFPYLNMGGKKLWLYSTRPEHALVGSVEINGVKEVPPFGPLGIWNHYAKQACVSKEWFDEYFRELEENGKGIVIFLENPLKLKRPITSYELKNAWV